MGSYTDDIINGLEDAIKYAETLIPEDYPDAFAILLGIFLAIVIDIIII